MNNATTSLHRESSKNEFLSFQLGKEEFCLEILKVQEIRGYGDITAITNTPDYIKGVVNLRGEIVPILDLRIRLNFTHVEYNEFTVVIILNLEGHNLGIVVDSVSDVIALNIDQISKLPEMLSSINTKYITGVVTIDTHTMILLDIDKLLNREELDHAKSQSVQ
ncbi:MAG: chemotaxis protein CheW [Methylophilaceae bacterium]